MYSCKNITNDSVNLCVLFYSKQIFYFKLFMIFQLSLITL